jgi:hypothetical protein
MSSLIKHKDYFGIDPLYLNESLEELLLAQDRRDYVLLADLYELKLMPLLTGLQEAIIGEHGLLLKDCHKENMEAMKQVNRELFHQLEQVASTASEDYMLEATSSGLPTLSLKINGYKYYLHSNKNPHMEAYYLARSWAEDDMKSYVIYGLGLGYHILELADVLGHCRIEVYESDLAVINLACSCSEMAKLLMNPNISLIFDPDCSLLMQRISGIEDDAGFVMHYPSVRNIKNAAIREKLENYFIQYSSYKNQYHILSKNFYGNIKQYDDPVDALKKEFQGKELIIVAAGPSLDQNYQLLKKVNREKAIILATGTVLRKLVMAGIRPDYFIVTDGNSRVYRQIEGYENETIPMLFLSTANSDFALRYKGRKYIIFQKGYSKAEEYAKEHGFRMFNTGGSVSTTALDIGIGFGCRRIVFVGLDLAYTDNLVHASNTSRRELNSTKDLLTVTDIHGRQVYTTKVLNIYREWIENRIRDEKEIEFIDATEGGAKIEGMRIATLEDVIMEWNKETS